ncbi:hypothetical protein scyTo_0000012 [Scyliorhinus torazame]|uniref:Uncharacterized protein n=1 Tax=Scyliorhinus torazame TaxID=75743 RepID=A0A401NMK6_SCYTO|nr:hypothetical protein [Scyliorhinus torazame]
MCSTSVKDKSAIRFKRFCFEVGPVLEHKLTLIVLQLPHLFDDNSSCLWSLKLNVALEHDALSSLMGIRKDISKA